MPQTIQVRVILFLIVSCCGHAIIASHVCMYVMLLPDVSLVHDSHSEAASSLVVLNPIGCILNEVHYPW